VAKVVLHLKVISSLRGYVRSSPIINRSGDLVSQFFYFLFSSSEGRKEKTPPDVQRDVVISRTLIDDDLGPDRSATPVLTTRAEPERRRDDLRVLALGRHLPLSSDGVPGPETVARRGAVPHDSSGSGRFLGRGRGRPPVERCRKREMPREDGDEDEEEDVRRRKTRMHKWNNDNKQEQY
jgi:hypothetical protein